MLKVVSYYGFFSRRQFSTNFDMRKQVSALLPIQMFCCAWWRLSIPEEIATESQTAHKGCNVFNNDSVISYNTKIPYIENTLKSIYLSATLLNEFNSIYYDDKNSSFEMLFKQYIASSIKKIITHP